MKIIKPLSPRKVIDAFLYGEEQDRLGNLTTDLTFCLDQQFIVKYLCEKTYGGIEYDFFVFSEDECIAVVQFERVDYLRKIWNIKNKNLLIPHSTIHPSYRGRGFSTFFYSLALKAGFTLVSQKHTVNASDLWRSIALKNNTSVINHCIVTGKSLPTQHSYTVKLLSL
jgi:hypothetical protein